MTTVRIVVCVQQVLDAGVGLRVEEERGIVVQDGPVPVHVLDPADRAALEAALQLASTPPPAASGAPDGGAGVRVTAVTLGPPADDVALRYCLARGAQDAVRVWDEALHAIDAPLTALVLARAAVSLEADLMLCGARSAARGTAQVPAAMAEILGLPQLTGVVGLELARDARVLRAQRRLERGSRMLLECALPALVAVAADGFPPRYVSWRARRRVRHGVRVLTLADLGVTPEDVAPERCLTQPVRLTRPRPRTKKVPAPAASGAALVGMLMRGGLAAAKPRGGGPLEGKPENLAAEIAAFLQDKGLLPRR